jgi:hypothetical protein
VGHPRWLVALQLWFIPVCSLLILLAPALLRPHAGDGDTEAGRSPWPRQGRAAIEYA